MVKVDGSNEVEDKAQLLKDRYSIFGAFFDGDKGTLKETPLTRGSSKIEDINQYFSQRTVVLSLGKAETPYNYFVSDLYGSNNDFAGSVQGAANDEDTPLFISDNNRVKVELGENVLNFERIKGAKGATWRDITSSNIIKPLTSASSNFVYITSDREEDVKKLDFDNQKNLANLIASERKYTATNILSQVDIDFYLKPSIMGGDALRAANNVVYLENVITAGIDRKFGIVGGRAQDGTNVNPISDAGADSIGNLVFIKNSAIGMIQNENQTTAGEQNSNSLPGTNIYGGLGYAVAKDNKVLISNSIVQGNVQGGVSFDKNFLTYGVLPFTNNQILAKFNFDFDLTNQENEVYLDSSRLVGKSALYASSGAIIFKTQNVGGWPGTVFNDAEIVNFRLGTAYINGENQASSIYAAEVIFGEKYITAEKPNNFFESKDTGNLNLVLDTENSDYITFGHSLGDSYVRNSSGFHSVLSRQTVNQSNVTNEKHNFWTNAVINLGSGSIDSNTGAITLTNAFDATGTELNTAVKIFDEKQNKGTVLQPVDHKFSLLAQDNLGGKKLQRGTKTYLGISSGYVLNDKMEIQEGGDDQVRALNLNWSRILKYRASYASGGRYTIDADKETKIDEFTKEPEHETEGAFASVLLPFPELEIKVDQGQTNAIEKYVWIRTDDEGNEIWYDNQTDYTNKENGLTDPKAKLAWIEKQYTNTHTVIAPLEQGGKQVALGTYSVDSYLDFGELYFVRDTDGRVPNFKGHIFALTPILKESINDFVDVGTDKQIEEGIFPDDSINAGKQYFIYNSLKAPGTVHYLCVVDTDKEGKEVRTYYEEVASTGDIVSITNINANQRGQEGGISLISLLTKVDVYSGQTLNLYGLPATSDPTDFNKASYTAEMEILGSGAISIPDANTVYIGGKDDQNQSFTGETLVGEKAKLFLEANNALGGTSVVTLKKESNLTITDHPEEKDKTETDPTSQVIKSFDAEETSSVLIEEGNTLTVTGAPDAGTLGRLSGTGDLNIESTNLLIAGKYATDEDATFSGDISISGESRVTTSDDPNKTYGWTQIGTGDIHLNDKESILTVNYSSPDTLAQGYENRYLSGLGKLNIVNKGDKATENFVFSSNQNKNDEKGTFEGTLALTRVDIDLVENSDNLSIATLEINEGSTAIAGTEKEAIKTGGIILNSGGTLDFSHVTNNFGSKAISNVLNEPNSTKEFTFSSGGVVKVDLTGEVPEFNANEFQGIPLLDQDDKGPFIYLGYGTVTSGSSLAGVEVEDKNGKPLGEKIAGISYNDGVATLTYELGLTDGSAVSGADQGFGIGYILKEVHVNQGKTLALRKGDVSNRLSAFLTSEETNAGKVEIYGDIYITNEFNSLASEIEVTNGSHLTANGGALGNDLYTQRVTLQEGSTFTLRKEQQSGLQIIGELNQEEKQSTVELTKDSTLILTKDSTSNGTVTGDGTLTVQNGNLDIFGENNNGFTGNLNIRNNASATTNNLDSLGLSTINVNKGGTLVLNLAENATWSQVNTRAKGVRTLVGDGTVIKDDNGILTIDENYKHTGTTIVQNGGVYVGQKDTPVQAPGSFVVEKLGFLRGLGSENNWSSVKGLTNSGTVFLNDEHLEEASPNTFVVDGDYVGQGGLLVFTAKLASDNDSLQDQLHITGNASGSSVVRVRNLNGEGAETDEGITLIQIDKNSTANFALESPLTVGAFNYQLFSTPDKKRWYLSTKNHIYSSKVGSYISAALASDQMNMRLHDRMGQSFVVDPASGEIYKAAGWVRQLGSHSHFRSGGNTTHMNTSVTQLGADLYRNKSDDDKNFVFGFFGGGVYSKSHTRGLEDTTKGKTDGFAVGVYGTYYTGATADDGFYVDTWLQYGRYDNRLYGGDNNFKYRSHGFSFSVETGLTIPLADLDEEGKTQFKMQPQAQIIVNGVKANNAMDKSGTEYRQLGRNNVLLRLGSRFMIQKENGLTAFAEGNWLHNTKKAGVMMDSDSVYMEGGRNLGEFKIGFEGRLSKNLHGWLTGSIRGGKGGYHTESAQIGLKYQF